LARVLPRARAALAGSILVGVFGAGQFVDGLAREDCAVSVNRECRAAIDAGRVSTHHRVHDAESLVTFAALLLAPLVLAFVFRSIPALRHLVPWSFAAAAVELASLVTFLVLFAGAHGGIGVFEIAAFVAGVGWIAALSVVVIREGGVLDSADPNWRARVHNGQCGMR
jgi:Protein of unknown function (DUF998)